MIIFWNKSACRTSFNFPTPIIRRCFGSPWIQDTPPSLRAIQICVTFHYIHSFCAARSGGVRATTFNPVHPGVIIWVIGAIISIGRTHEGRYRHSTIRRELTTRSYPWAPITISWSVQRI